MFEFYSLDIRRNQTHDYVAKADPDTVKIEAFLDGQYVAYIQKWENGWAFVLMDGTYCVTGLTQEKAIEKLEANAFATTLSKMEKVCV